MEITEIRVALREEFARSASGGSGTEAGDPRAAGEKRLKAYATLTFDHCFVVRNIKVIEGKHGLFVAMPSHKPKVACARCRFKNDAGGHYCSQCGAQIPPAVVTLGPEGAEAPSHRDIAHPVTVEFRQYLHQKVIEAYEAERARHQQGA